MKNKLTRNKKFNLDKIEVAKLNKLQMLRIVGGLPEIIVPTTGHNDGLTTRQCAEETDKPK